MIRPPTIRPGGSGTSLIMDSAVIVFPEPLSPTTPSVSPWCIRKLTPSTALTTPSRVKKWVFRLITSSNGGPCVSSAARAIKLVPHARVHRVSQSVAHEGEPEHRQRDQDCWEQDH